MHDDWLKNKNCLSICKSLYSDIYQPITPFPHQQHPSTLRLPVPSIPNPTLPPDSQSPITMKTFLVLLSLVGYTLARLPVPNIPNPIPPPDSHHLITMKIFLVLLSLVEFLILPLLQIPIIS